MEMKETNPNLQIHCVHPGHIGTNIAATARFDEENFNQDGRVLATFIIKRALGKIILNVQHAC